MYVVCTEHRVDGQWCCFWEHNKCHQASYMLNSFKYLDITHDAPNNSIIDRLICTNLINIRQMFNLGTEDLAVKTIHPTQKFNSMNLLQMPHVITRT
jgi:hypothetical protein